MRAKKKKRGESAERGTIESKIYIVRWGGRYNKAFIIAERKKTRHGTNLLLLGSEHLVCLKEPLLVRGIGNLEAGDAVDSGSHLAELCLLLVR